MITACDLATDTIGFIERGIPELVPVGNGWSFNDSEELPYTEAIKLRARMIAYESLIYLGINDDTAHNIVYQSEQAHAHKIVKTTIAKYKINHKQNQPDLFGEMVK